MSQRRQIKEGQNSGPGGVQRRRRSSVKRAEDIIHVWDARQHDMLELFPEVAIRALQEGLRNCLEKRFEGIRG
jgi:hypothetical protein